MLGQHSRYTALFWAGSSSPPIWVGESPSAKLQDEHRGPERDAWKNFGRVPPSRIWGASVVHEASALPANCLPVEASVRKDAATLRKEDGIWRTASRRAPI